MNGHWARDDRTDHEGAHVYDPVESVPFATIVEEEDICDDCRLNGFRRTGAEAIESASSHETTVGLCSSSPDTRNKIDDLGGQIDRASTERGAEWNPEEIAETENEDGDASELDSFGEGAVELFDVVFEHRRQRQWAKPLGEGDHARCSDGSDLPPEAPVQRIILVVRGLGDQYSVALVA